MDKSAKAYEISNTPLFSFLEALLVGFGPYALTANESKIQKGEHVIEIFCSESNGCGMSTHTTCTKHFA